MGQLGKPADRRMALTGLPSSFPSGFEQVIMQHTRVSRAGPPSSVSSSWAPLFSKSDGRCVVKDEDIYAYPHEVLLSRPVSGMLSAVVTLLDDVYDRHDVGLPRVQRDRCEDWPKRLSELFEVRFRVPDVEDHEPITFAET